MPLVHSNVFSFSSAGRLMACHASRRMSVGQVNKTNAMAELGTAAHELGEYCIRFGFNPEECEGMTFYRHTVDANMIDAAKVYVGYVRSLEVQHGVKAMLETRVTMSSLGRDDVFGTSDCIMVVGNTVYVIDYKHGYGVVDVVDNPQLIAYALATVDTLQLWGSITKVVTTIVQPRKGHIDGPIRSCEYSLEYLRDQWWPKYYEAVKEGENPNAPTVAGPHCKHCLARGYCRARIMYTLRTVYWDKPIDVMTNEEMEILYNEVDNVKTNIEAIQGKSLEIAREGYQFEGYKLVDSITRFKCIDEPGLVEAAKKEGVDENKLYDRKVKSKTAISKLVPYKIVNQFYERPPTSTTLVPMSDNRPAKRNSFGAVPQS